MARILIAGCGDVGTALGVRLRDDGHEVWGLRRRAANLPDAILPVAADLAAPSGLDALPRDIEIVYYAAAADGRSDQAYRAAYVDGVRHLQEALCSQARPPRRFIFVSSTGVYGQRDGSWVDEDSRTEPAGFSGRRLLEGEALALGAAGGGVVVRFGGIYGPGRDRLIRLVRDGAPCREGLYTNRIHRDDCAGALAHLLAVEEPASVYLGVDDEPAAQCEVMTWLAERLGVAPPSRAPGGDRPSRGNKRCRNRRLRASGYRFLYPSYREGYSALLVGGEPRG